MPDFGYLESVIDGCRCVCVVKPEDIIDNAILSEVDLLQENGHAFVDIAKLGLRHEGKCCLDCFMRR